MEVQIYMIVFYDMPQISPFQLFRSCNCEFSFLKWKYFYDFQITL